MADKIQYRDSLLRRVLISVSDPIKEAASDRVVAVLNFDSIDDRMSFNVSLVWSQVELAGLGLRNIGNISTIELAKLAKWLVVNGSYRQDYREIWISTGKLGHLNFRVDQNGNFTFLYPPLVDLPVRESQICRRALISELYRAGIAIRQNLIKDAHMPIRTVEYELAGLGTSPYLSHSHTENIHHESAHLFLTTVGREYYERSLRQRSGIAFIIGACHAYDRAGAVVSDVEAEHLKVLELYKDVLREAGYDPKFQEHEEPQKNIYVDIFDYIDASEIVIADITWERPSCYIEIGWALANQKPVLLFVEGSYFKSQMGARLPFDLSVVKYQEYTYADSEVLKKELRERIDVWRGRQQHT
jgi:hypothetical protein